MQDLLIGASLTAHFETGVVVISIAEDAGARLRLARRPDPDEPSSADEPAPVLTGTLHWQRLLDALWAALERQARDQEVWERQRHQLRLEAAEHIADPEA